MKPIELAITEAASDYKMALKNTGFADYCGGIDAVRERLLKLVTEWEGYLSDEEMDQ